MQDLPLPSSSHNSETKSASPQDSTSAVVTVGAVDTSFPTFGDEVATDLAPDLNHATTILEPTVGEMDTAFPAPEGEADVEGAAAPPPIPVAPRAAMPAPSTPPSASEGEADVEGAFSAKPISAAKVTTTVGEVATEFNAEPSSPPPLAAAPPPSAPIPPPPSRPRGCLRQSPILLLTAILGALIALAVIFTINGTLDFSRHEVIAALNSDIGATNTRLDEEHAALQDISDIVQTNAAQVEALAAQVQSLSQQTRAFTAQIDARSSDMDAIRKDIDTLATQNIQLQEQVAAIDTEIARFQQMTARFDTFAQGLKNLAETIQPHTAPLAPTDAVAPTATVTPTAAVTPTATPTPLPDISSQQIDTDIVTGSYTLQIFPPQPPIHLPPSGQSLIFGLIWDDLNRNGLPEANEIPLPNVHITLKDIHNKHLAETTTTADGHYIFPDLSPGAYIITETDPPGMTSITPNTVTAVANGLVEVNFADSHPTSP